MLEASNLDYEFAQSVCFVFLSVTLFKSFTYNQWRAERGGGGHLGINISGGISILFFFFFKVLKQNYEGIQIKDLTYSLYSNYQFSPWHVLITKVVDPIHAFKSKDFKGALI